MTLSVDWPAKIMPQTYWMVLRPNPNGHLSPLASLVEGMPGMICWGFYQEDPRAKGAHVWTSTSPCLAPLNVGQCTDRRATSGHPAALGANSPAESTKLPECFRCKNNHNQALIISLKPTDWSKHHDLGAIEIIRCISGKKQLSNSWYWAFAVWWCY